MDDLTLLREYADRGSEDAFRTLVQRYTNLVYTAALRQTGDPQMAEDVTQAVFIILAQKAGRIRAGITLVGWLFKAARFAASAQLKAAARRRRREEEAQMDSAISNDASFPDEWEQMAPLLDGALSELAEVDRQAVLLRFFENKSLAEVGGVLAVNEDAARKRIIRALEKLRRIFLKRGVVLSVAAMGGALSAHAVQAAPAGLAASAATAALAQGTATAASTVTLVKGALELMAWTKVKTLAVVGAAVLLAGGTTTVVVTKVVPRLREPSIDESMWQPNSATLRTVPPVLILRPAKPSKSSSGVADSNGKAMWLNTDLRHLLATAYNVPETRMVLPDGLPDGKFDLMLTLNDHPREALQAEIRKRFGLVAHVEARDTDKLVLKISTPNAPGLTRSAGGGNGQRGGGGARFMSQSSSMKSVSASGILPPQIAARLGGAAGGSGNQSTMNLNNTTLAGFAKYLEQRLNQPVTDETGTTDRFDIKLAVQLQGTESPDDALKRSVLEQLGMELAPDHDATEMLVVERTR